MNNLIPAYLNERALQARAGVGITIGSDPEIFITTKTRGTIVPAYTFLPDKKDTLVEESYWDGFQAEFNTRASTTTEQEISSIRTALKKLETSVLAVRGDAKLSYKSVIRVSKALLKETKKEQAAFGCMPSSNAYGDNPQLPDGAVTQVRTAGGHLHFGWRPEVMPTPDQMIAKVKALDAVVGVISVAMFSALDDPKRREFYGRAGEFRLPPHGLEYRVLSNAWLMHPEYASIIKNISKSVIQLCEPDAPEFEWICEEQEVRDCINNNDRGLALKIIRENTRGFNYLVSCYQGQGSWRARSYILEGAPLRPNISLNWNLASVRAA